MPAPLPPPLPPAPAQQRGPSPANPPRTPLSPISQILGNNTVYTPNAAPTVACGKTYSLKDWVALGLDVGTTAATLPDAATIIGWAKETLGMQ